MQGSGVGGWVGGGWKGSSSRACAAAVVKQFPQDGEKATIDAGKLKTFLDFSTEVNTIRANSAAAIDSHKLSIGLPAATAPFFSMCNVVRKMQPGEEFGGGFHSLPMQTCISFGRDVAQHVSSGLLDEVDAFATQAQNTLADTDGFDAGECSTKLSAIKTRFHEIRDIVKTFVVDAMSKSSISALPVAPADLEDCVDEHGKLAAAISKKVDGMDLAKHSPLYDQVLGCASIVNALGTPSDDTSMLEAGMALCTAMLPVLKVMQQCETTFENASRSTTEDGDRLFLKLFGQVLKDVTRTGTKLNRNTSEAECKQGLLRWQSRMYTLAVGVLALQVKDIESTSSQMSPHMLDCKEILKNWTADGMQKLIDMEGRTELKSGIKALGAKTTRAKAWLTILRTPDEDKLKAEEASVDYAIELRKQAKVQITVRSGVLVVQSNDGSKVESFMDNAKNAHVTVPKWLKCKLDSLPK